MKKNIIIALCLLSFVLISCSKSSENVSNAVNTYTITFDSNGGTAEEPIAIQNNINSIVFLVDQSSEPTKNGYLFGGWYKDNSLVMTFDFSNMKITSDITLYAKWIKNVSINDFILVNAGTVDGITVTNSFYMSKYEIMQNDYEELMGYNPSGWKENNRATSFNRPVENVTWFDAVTYANKLSEKEGLSKYYNISPVIGGDGDTIRSAVVTTNSTADGYRLPTSNEWKFVYKGGNSSNNYIYSGSNNYNEVGWVYENSTLNGEGYGTKVSGRKNANELGVYDMLGNVSEWINNTNISPSSSLYLSCYGGNYETKISNSIIVDLYNYYEYSYNIGFRLVRPN